MSEFIFIRSGESAAVAGAGSDFAVDALAHYYSARPALIDAGSNEIQRNIMARHVLLLPT